MCIGSCCRSLCFDWPLRHRYVLLASIHVSHERKKLCFDVLSFTLINLSCPSLLHIFHHSATPVRAYISLHITSVYPVTTRICEAYLKLQVPVCPAKVAGEDAENNLSGRWVRAGAKEATSFVICQILRRVIFT